MSIEQKIAELLEESAKLKLMEETTEEEVVAEEFEQLDEEEFDALSEEDKEIYEASFQQHADAQQNRHGAKFKKGIHDDKPNLRVTRNSGSSSSLPTKDSPYDAQGNKPTSNMFTREKAASIKKKLVHGARSYAQKNEEFDVQEDVDALLFGEDLTEEFKVKAATIFEAAVMARVNAEVETLEEAFEARLAEQAELDKEEIIEKVDGYLGYVVEQWMSDNEIAIENGLKSDILEGFVDGLKTLFVEHYIEVPEERFDIVGDLQEQVDFLESKLDESLEQNVQMMKELNEKTRDAVTGDFCSDMTDTEVEKFTALAEELAYEDAENFASKLQIIKENYFGKKPLTQVESVVTDSPVQLNEETKHVDANVARYLETFNRLK